MAIRTQSRSNANTAFTKSYYDVQPPASTHKCTREVSELHAASSSSSPFSIPHSYREWHDFAAFQKISVSNVGFPESYIRTPLPMTCSHRSVCGKRVEDTQRVEKYDPQIADVDFCAGGGEVRQSIEIDQKGREWELGRECKSRRSLKRVMEDTGSGKDEVFDAETPRKRRKHRTSTVSINSTAQ
jgi:hypothetical protein